ncbi:MAG: ABC transporter permease subunit [Gemmataceae bacterium]|nr:ABC transporter permease subunit [Gemmataceae bacterium]
MLGPHFQFDVVRLARKGYPMLLRAAYLTILLAGLALLFFSQGNVVRPRDFAARAHVYAYVLIVLQNILVLALIGHLVIARRHLRRAISHMKIVRLHAAAPRKPKGPSVFALTDHSTQKVRAARRRGAQSRIHPAALPIPDTALHWKETLKDGSEYSLTYRWLRPALLVVLLAAVPCRIVDLSVGLDHAEPLRNMARALTYTAYFVSLSLYALVIVFQTTLSVAGEREQDTLVFLLLIPESRTAILWHKWLGPLWRNWPLLAVAYLGVLFGLACGIYSAGTALILFAFPWPWLFLISLVALLLSVLCRRVLIANLCLIGFLVLLLLGHVAGQRFIGIVFPFYASILFETNLLSLLRDVSWSETMWKALAHQGAFLLVAGVCGLLAFWRFQRKEYASA